MTTICRVYLNFVRCQPFVDAVSRDGRSYSPALFGQAEDVLIKVGSMDFIEDLKVTDQHLVDLHLCQPS